jgi:hypothetical protein
LTQTLLPFWIKSNDVIVVRMRRPHILNSEPRQHYCEFKIWCQEVLSHRLQDTEVWGYPIKNRHWTVYGVNREELMLIKLTWDLRDRLADNERWEAELKESKKSARKLVDQYLGRDLTDLLKQC